MTNLDPKTQRKYLQEVSESCWDVLIRWFIEHGYNNFYGNSFYDIMNMVFKVKDEKVTFTILFKIGLLLKMTSLIEIFQKRETTKDFRFIIHTTQRICLSLSAAVNVSWLI